MAMITQSDKAERLNVLFFMTDQHRADCLSLAGHPLVKTPYLDALAARGAWFNNMYTCSALCCPSRTSFMTSTYLRTHQHYSNGGNLRRDLPNLPALAQAAGYRTGVTGKAHLPERILRHFDSAQTVREHGKALRQQGLQDVPDTPDFHRQFMSACSPLPYAAHETTWTADRAIDFLKAGSDPKQPFFLWCSFTAPHPPLTPPAEMDDLYKPESIPLDWEGYARFENSRLGQRAMIEDFWKLGSVKQDPGIFQKALCRYLAHITMVDREIGRVLKALEQNGQAGRTLIVFSADHGDFAGRWGQIGKNIPAYDDLLRIPFLYVDPTRQDGGRCVESLHQSVDLLPSLCERLGWETPPTAQGISLLPALDGCPGAGREAVFAETHNVKTIRTRQWKLNLFGPHPSRGQLFRMGANPDELTNLWDDPACVAIKCDLLEQLMAWTIRCEQPPAMEWKAEAFVDSRWYRWLKEQPHQCESDANGRNRG